MPDRASAATRAHEPDPAPPAPPARPLPSRGLLALAGALAGVAGVLVSQAVADVSSAPASPVSAVAGAVRDLTPGRLAINLIHLVGHLDKPLLVGGTTVVLLGLCALAGSLARRHPVAPDLVFAALAALGVAAELRQANPSFAGVLAVAAGFVTWLVAFRVLSRPLLDVPPREATVGAAVEDRSRRDFLVRAGVVVVLSGAVALAGRMASGGRRQAEQARRLLRLPVHRGTEPSGSTIGVAGIEPWRTPVGDFYVVHTAIAPPTIAPADWRLRVHGMVENEITLTFDQLLARPLTEAWITLCCVSNEVGGDLIGNAFWSGTLLRDLLAEARPTPGADAVRSTSKDGWTAGTPLPVLTDPNRNAMLAVGMNGAPLPLQHGFPVRMVVPGLYGFVSATKWVVDLEVTTMDRVNAYWTERGWSVRGPVKTQSRIDVPGDGASVKAGSVRVGGSAWAQHTGIAKVEFQLDGGPWQEAELGRVPDLDTWVQWAGTVDVQPGSHRLHVRATDHSGYVQTAARADPFPSGATGWDSRSFTAG